MIKFSFVNAKRVENLSIFDCSLSGWIQDFLLIAIGFFLAEIYKAKLLMI